MSKRLRVLLTDRAWPDSDIEQKIFDEVGVDLIEPPDSSEPTLIRLAGDIDAIGTCWAPLSRRVIEAAQCCRVISRFGIGLDNICDEKLAGAVLDVFDPEPPDLTDPLFQDERVILTPHAAFLSEQSLHDLRSRAARQIAQVLQGVQPEYVVNPQVYE